MNNCHVSVALLLPTLNEIDGLTKILPLIDRSLFDDILMVDGGSTDGTIEFALSHNIRVMKQPRAGLGYAIFDAVLELKTDCVIEFSMDGNCLIEPLSPMIQKLKEGYDLVVASRYLPPAKSYDDNMVTAFGNWMFSQMVRFLGPFPITDSCNMYRGFRSKIINFPEFEAFLVGPVFEPLVSAVANYRRLRICEIPGDEPARIGGISKMSIIYNGSCVLWMIFKMYLLKFRLLRP